ncbi:hypothetical protein QBZ16_001542 [Prototheca wickerhamii]|uniref:4-(cytidine 5'-diphospho)-2-C-methyl-D-erythritol kinase n=1 Tax=Prototheca wickerhamii TaxID=3111 RepID=A0AAD9ID71_PROWI|nr:hypothetical protein QBZ16_001542 [Prototheca wickerhamii]
MGWVINLFLRVERRREDGFHDLASLFQVVSWGDDMAFQPLGSSAGRDELVCNVADIPTDSRNLAIKALDLFRRKTGSQERFRVWLDKRVPHGAGLGGGSGNAATALWAANELSGRPAGREDLAAWAGEIGSDISVFFGSGASYCLGLSTPAVFKALRLASRSAVDPRQLLAELQKRRTVTQDICVNDLEQPAFELLEELTEIRARMVESGAFSAVFMTGSGSTMVGVGSDALPETLAHWRRDLFVAPARPLLRDPWGWYARPHDSLLRALLPRVEKPTGLGLF